MSFICIIIENHFHINGFALSLALKVRFFGTRKWPIRIACLLPWIKRLRRKFLRLREDQGGDNNRTIILNCWFARDVTAAMLGGQEQKHFSPLGTKLYFHVNSTRKISIVLNPTWPPYHVVANQQ